MDTILICFENGEVVKAQRFAQLGVAKIVANGWLRRQFDDDHFEYEVMDGYFWAEDGNSRYVVIV